MAAMQLLRVRLPQRHCDIGTCKPQFVSGVIRPAPNWPTRERFTLGRERSVSVAWTPMAATRRHRACLGAGLRTAERPRGQRQSEAPVHRTQGPEALECGTLLPGAP